jgi:hypothetical protein
MEGYHTTYEGLHGWYKCLFEKYGWMLLAQRQQHQEKIQEYLMSLHRLGQELMHKREQLEENDRKLDLSEMLYNLRTLKMAAHAQFGRCALDKEARKSYGVAAFDGSASLPTSCDNQREGALCTWPGGWENITGSCDRNAQGNLECQILEL